MYVKRAKNTHTHSHCHNHMSTKFRIFSVYEKRIKRMIRYALFLSNEISHLYYELDYFQYIILENVVLRRNGLKTRIQLFPHICAY